MKPWITGPKELLEHAEVHMKLNTAFDQRISLISIDNAVELAVKTYLGLPSRIRKTQGPSRKKLLEASNSFPDLLDLLEEFGSEIIQGIELGDIEWYHRLRNTLYHDGNGITVDPEKVDSYFQIARILMESLFGESLSVKEESPKSELGDLIIRWASLERLITKLFYFENPKEQGLTRSAHRLIQWLSSKDYLKQSEIEKLNNIRMLRNELVHGGVVPKDETLKDSIMMLDDVYKYLSPKLEKLLTIKLARPPTSAGD